MANRTKRPWQKGEHAPNWKGGISIDKKAYYKNNKEKIRAYHKSRYSLNRKKMNEYHRNWMKSWSLEKKEHRKLVMKQWREKNKERIKVNRKKYAGLYNGRYITKDQAYRKKYREKRKEWSRKYKLLHPEKIKEWSTRYNRKRGIKPRRKASPPAFYAARHRARKKGNGGSHTIAEWEHLKALYSWTCPCCWRKEPMIKLTEDHIVPLSKGGTDDIGNIQPLCKSCNSKKHTKDTKYPLDNVQ